MTNLTAKQEKFCNNIVEGMSQYDAYIDSHPDIDTTNREWIDVEANKEMKNPKIALRIKFLRQPVVDKLEITLEKLLNELEEIKTKTGDNEDYTNCIKAIQEQGKLSGLYVDKRDITSKGKSIAIVPEENKEWGK